LRLDEDIATGIRGVSLITTSVRDLAREVTVTLIAVNAS